MKQPLGKYMLIEEIDQKPKTKVYQITSKSNGSVLGYIEWYAPWRQYCFNYNTLIFNDCCLSEIVTFLSNLKKQRKELQK